jgi:hypothetical protein
VVLFYVAIRVTPHEFCGVFLRNVSIETKLVRIRRNESGVFLDSPPTEHSSLFSYSQPLPQIVNPDEPHIPGNSISVKTHQFRTVPRKEG